MTTPNKREPVEERWAVESNGPAGVAYEKALERVVDVMTSIKTTLNTDVNECHACGQEHKNDWNQWLAFEALSGAITRAQKAASLISLSISGIRDEPQSP